jgi:aspartyl-tRNA(Asn)/glutamyl-tRNA(Gln) amidotransferase subunit C
MALSRETVVKVASLARLELTDAEIELFGGQLGAILDYVTQLDELDVSNVEPMVHVEDLANVLRNDVVHPSLPREDALANAPSTDGRCFLVPAIL